MPKSANSPIVAIDASSPSVGTGVLATMARTISVNGCVASAPLPIRFASPCFLFLPIDWLFPFSVPLF
jgi:hypothetical protein